MNLVTGHVAQVSKFTFAVTAAAFKFQKLGLYTFTYMLGNTNRIKQGNLRRGNLNSDRSFITVQFKL